MKKRASPEISNGEIKSKTVFTSFIWRFLERFGAQVITFFVSIILARFLDPEVYGLVALVTVITTILQVFVDGGLGNALIQKKDADDIDFSTVFYFNIFVCTSLYLIIFFLSPLIAGFYNARSLTSVIRVLCLIIVISGIKNVQQAFVSRNMLFKRFFFSTLIGTLLSAVVGIVLAIKGAGVWALVFQLLTNTTVDTIVLWITVRWRPKKVFSFKRLKVLFKFGWKMLAASLVHKVVTETSQLIIGKQYSKADLAYYNQGIRFPNMLTSDINTSIDSVLFPAVSRKQNNIEQVKRMTRKSVQVCTFLIAPMLIGLAVCGTPLITLLLGEKWLPCVPYMQIFCFGFLFYPINIANSNAIKSIGRSDHYLIIELIKKAVELGLILTTMWFGTIPMAIGFVATNVIAQIIIAIPNRKLIGYSLREQWMDISIPMIFSIIMGAILFLVPTDGSSIVLLLKYFVVGVSIYFAFACFFKLPGLTHISSVLKTFRRNVKK